MTQKDKPTAVFVAGQKGKMRIGGSLLKPVSERSYEVKFYERVQDPTDVLHAFKPFVPVFKGLETLEAEDHVMTEFLVMGDLLAAYKKPACMDVKIGLPHHPQLRANLTATGVANLLGCFVHGVDATDLVHLNRVNGYIGREVSVGLFQEILRGFFKRMDKCETMIDTLLQLVKILESLKGYLFDSTSLFFVFEQDSTGTAPPSVALIDFERVSITSSLLPDIPVITSIKHVLNEMRLVWEKNRRTVMYLVAGDDGEEEAHAVNISERLGYSNSRVIVSSCSKSSVIRALPLAKKLNMKIRLECGLTWNSETNLIPEYDPHFDLSSDGSANSDDYKRWIDNGIVSLATNMEITDQERVKATIQKLIDNFDCKEEQEGTSITHQREEGLITDTNKEKMTEKTNETVESEVVAKDIIVFASLPVIKIALDLLIPGYEQENVLIDNSITMVVRDSADKGKCEILSFNEQGHLKDK